jgi:hypothetical protein
MTRLLMLALMLLRVALVSVCARASVHEMTAVQWMYHVKSVAVDRRSCG